MLWIPDEGRRGKSLSGYAIHFNTILFLFDFSLNSDFRLPVLKAGLSYVTEAFFPSCLNLQFLLPFCSWSKARSPILPPSLQAPFSLPPAPNYWPRPVQFTSMGLLLLSPFQLILPSSSLRYLFTWHFHHNLLTGFWPQNFIL